MIAEHDVTSIPDDTAKANANSGDSEDMTSRALPVEVADETDCGANIAPSHRTRLLQRLGLLSIVIGFVLLFLFYLNGLSTNPPGFYVDESAISYNAYCIARTGADEFGVRF